MLQRRLLQGSLGRRWGRALLQGSDLLAHGLQEGVALAAAIFTSRGQGGEWPGGAVPCVYFWKAKWSLRLRKRRRSVEAVEEEFPPVAQLVGNGSARTAPSLLRSAGCSQGTRHQRVLLRSGQALARSKPGAVPRARCRSSPCRQRWGEAAGLAWLGERQFCFLFSGQGGVAGQAASAASSPAPSRTGGKERLYS